MASPARDSTRRALADRSACTLLALAAWQRPRPAAAALDVETIRQAASAIPGYGQPDVYYPSVFRGRWRAERQVFDVRDSQDAGGAAVRDSQGAGGAAMPGLAAVAADARRLAAAGASIRYDVRFIEREAPERAVIVADRAFNAEALAMAARARDTARPIADWSPRNPNILTLRDGAKLVEFKVTRRAFEAPLDGAFGTSEYERVADAGSDGVLGGVPMIQARRVETRYRWPAGDVAGDGSVVIEALERVSWFDPTQTGFADLKGASPSLVVKSRIRLERAFPRADGGSS